MKIAADNVSKFYLFIRSAFEEPLADLLVGEVRGESSGWLVQQQEHLNLAAG